MQKYLSQLVLLIMLLPVTGQASSFFQQRYRGWLWFESPSVTEQVAGTTRKEDKVGILPKDELTPLAAKAEIEQFAKELEELKFLMLARPTPLNVKAYRDKEQAMWRQAEMLHDSWDMANLLYPEQRDLINNPVNVHAIKARRAKMQEEDSEKIITMAKKFDLVLFFAPDCRYCQALAPVLQHFALTYGFKVEAISLDGSEHEYFTTSNAPELISRLGITEFPIVIAVSHDSKIAFELIRGYVSIAELEEYSLLAIKHLASLPEAKKVNNSIMSND